MKKATCWLLPAIVFLSLCAKAQNVEPQRGEYELAIKKTATPIKIDGQLDEAAWQIADEAADFFLNKPFDTAFASLQTIVKTTFDDNYLYISAICFQPQEEITISSLKRDFEGGSSDVLTINLDPFKDGLNGFHFAVSPMNVQRESLIENGEGITNYWDNRWYSEVVRYQDRWVVEVAIPFKTLRYKLIPGVNTWRINFARNSLKRNEISTWVPVPRNFVPNNMAYMGQLIWQDPPPKPGMNVALIPYVNMGWVEDYPRDETNLQRQPTHSDWTANAGLDAKVAITPSLNLDLTVNPDFSQVEVDRQVTNISRFELFFPERRQFFLENNDLFGFYGFPDARPFFSRRIGIARNPNTGLNEQVPILAGARLSGKINDNWRLGLLNMQTKKLDFGDDAVLPTANYSFATAQRKVFKRSVLGGFFVNKQNFLDGLTPQQREGYQPYNRVAGMEFNLYSEDNRWEAESYFHRSFSPEQLKNPMSAAQFIGFNSPHFYARGAFQYIGEGYRAESGFVPRPGVQSSFVNTGYIYNPGGRLAKSVNNFSLNLEGNYTFDLKGRPLDHSSVLIIGITMQDQSEGGIAVGKAFSYLQDSDYDPTNPYLNPDPDVQNDYSPLPAGGYVFDRWYAGFESSQRNDFTFEIEVEGGEFYKGRQLAAFAEMGYRIQPIGVVSLAATYNNVKMPEPYNSSQFWLIGPRAELSFSRSIFFSTFLQYNTQTNNVNVNSRFQWRFRPVSDLFIVYTDNYFAESIPAYYVKSFAPKNKTLVVKITYWLNV